MTAKTKRIQVFSWTDKHGNEQRWNVDAAHDLLREFARKPDIQLSLAQMRQALARNAHAPALSAKRIKQADTTQPVLIIQLPDESCVLIDGWHRIAKAVQQKQKSIEAYLLPPEISDLFKIESATHAGASQKQISTSRNRRKLNTSKSAADSNQRTRARKKSSS